MKTPVKKPRSSSQRDHVLLVPSTPSPPPSSSSGGASSLFPTASRIVLSLAGRFPQPVSLSRCILPEIRVRRESRWQGQMREEEEAVVMVARRRSCLAPCRLSRVPLFPAPSRRPCLCHGLHPPSPSTFLSSPSSGSPPSDAARHDSRSAAG